MNGAREDAGTDLRPDAEAAREPKAAARVASVLRRRIISGDLRPGDALPKEIQLTGALGVSRPTLREAFRILESEHLLEIRRGVQGGPRVRTPVPEVPATYVGQMLQLERVPLEDVRDALTVLEAPAARRLAADPHPEAIARLRANLAEAAEPAAGPGEDPAERLARLSREFHTLVVALAGNRTLHIFDTMTQHILDRAERSHVDTGGAGAHAEFTDLVEAGDVPGAEALWRHHLDEVAGELLSSEPGALVDLRP